MQGIELILMISLPVLSVLSLPVGKETSESKEAIATYQSMQKPTNILICLAGKIRRLYKKESKITGFPGESSYDKQFKTECINKFGEESTKTLKLEQRFVFAMKLFQKLVGLSQDMQISESRINGGDETEFVRDFRDIEYKIRELVEDNMRRASDEIVRDLTLRGEIPDYSVGGLIDETTENKGKENKQAVNKKNYEKMHQIEECLNHFQKYIIVPQVGSGDSFNEWNQC